MGETPIRGPLPGGERTDGIGRTGGPGRAAPGAQPAQSDRTGAPAFEALLEKLERQAADLRTDASGVEKPEQLAGAVENARASLEGALSLGESLLEAYRQTLRQGEASAATDRAPRPGSD